MSDEMPESQCKLKLEDVAIDLMRRLGNGEMLDNAIEKELKQ